MGVKVGDKITVTVQVGDWFDDDGKLKKLSTKHFVGGVFSTEYRAYAILRNLLVYQELAQQNKKRADELRQRARSLDSGMVESSSGDSSQEEDEEEEE